jgi:hypothetical protein
MRVEIKLAGSGAVIANAYMNVLNPRGGPQGEVMLT